MPLPAWFPIVRPTRAHSQLPGGLSTGTGFPRRSPVSRLAEAVLVALAAICLGASAARAQTIHTVTNLDDSGAGSMRQAILDANNSGGANTILFEASLTGTITLASDLETISDDGLTIDGSGASITISGNNTYRCFFIGAWSPGTSNQIAVNVTIAGLTFSGCKAQGGAGGSGAVGGGGGAGLGGAIFVANLAHVSLSNISLSGNNATGGTGGAANGSLYGAGGGGGMGGIGGPALLQRYSGGGGGGLGVGANGGTGTITILSSSGNGAAGIAFGAESGGSGIIPPCAFAGSGGNNGGGGGGSVDLAPSGSPTGCSTGAGGGVGGQGDVFLLLTEGGKGGFGGGGGGQGEFNGGPGGFGGGGGASSGSLSAPFTIYAGAGGFGGGSGGSNLFAKAALGGFGGGNGGNGVIASEQGGGGLGAGGAVFVQQGGTVIFTGSLAEAGDTVTKGLAGTLNATDGSAFGSAIFIQGNNTITFSPGSGDTQTIAGVIADQTGSGGTGDNAGAGGLTMNGAGTLVLSGANTYSDPTTVESGTLDVNGSLSAPTTVSVWCGATLGGTGTIKGNVVLYCPNALDTSDGLTVTGTTTTMLFTASAGTPQAALINTAFPTPLTVTVTQDGAGLSGLSITFTAPGSGATAALSNSATCTTDSNGSCSVTATANGTIGSYVITAAVNGFSPLGSVSFDLTNSLHNYVVNTTADNNSGSCTALFSTTTNSTDASCTLRAALTEAATEVEPAVLFDSTVFSSSKTAAQNTITLTAGTLNIPSNTSIFGPASGVGPSLKNLVTISGGSVNNRFPLFTVASGVVGASIMNVTLAQSGSEYAGGIDNAGSLTVQYSTITGMQADQAGAIYNNGGTLVIADSTISGNHSEYGGALYTVAGSVTVMNSTITGNSGAIGSGGLLVTGGSLNVIGTTISGNFVGLYGPGIYNTHGTLTVTNSIVSGNQQGTQASPGNYDDIDDQSGATTFTTGNGGGNVIGYYNANSATAPSPAANLVPLGNNGGPTQTMLPLPGSAAICDGLLTNIPSGVTTDQRGLGFPNTNSTYPGYTPSNPACVDSGAVQTNYAIAFTQQPSTSSTTPATIGVGAILTPTPAVTVTESGLGVTGATVAITASGLNGTTSQTTAGGVATFSGLSVPAPENGDVLNASLSLNPNLSPALSLPAASFAFNVVYVPPSLTTPTPSGPLPSGSSVYFAWDPGQGISSFQLKLGTQGRNSFDVYNGPQTTAHNITVPVPTYGVTLYARLYYKAGSAWSYLDYTYTESGTSTPAALTTPTPSTTLPSGSSVNFAWDPGHGPDLFELKLGTRHSLYDIYNGPQTTATNVTVPVPVYGAPLYARLFYRLNLVWYSIDYTYTDSGVPVPPSLTTPTPSTTLPSGSSVNFAWDPGHGSDLFQLKLGTQGRNSFDVYNGPQTAIDNITVPVPIYGVTLYARLYYRLNSVWSAIDYTYTESGAPTPASLTTPTPSTTLPSGSSVNFAWDPGQGPDLFQLKLGTGGPGAHNVYNGPQTTANNITVPVPTNGVTLNARLYYRLNLVWHYLDYTYTETGP